MISIYKNRHYFDDINIIIDNEGFFEDNISLDMLSNSDLQEALKKIDNAEIIDYSIGTIKTPYGITSIKSISTGCKTVINYLILRNNKETLKEFKVISATEAGWNAIEVLFEYMEKYNETEISVLLEHEDDVYLCSEREYLINGSIKINSMFDFYTI